MGRYGVVVAKVRAMTSQQVRESLVAAGIIGKDGKLTKKYKPKKR